MTIPVNFTLPDNSLHQLAVAQSQNPNTVQHLSPGETFNGAVHAANAITFSEGPEVIQDPPGDTGSLS